MKNKEPLFSPMYGCVFLNEKEEIKREDFDPKVLEELLGQQKDFKVPDMSGKFLADKKDFLSLFKNLRDTYQSQITKIETGIKEANLAYAYLLHKGSVTENPFESDIADAEKTLEKLRGLVDPLNKEIERLEKEIDNG